MTALFVLLMILVVGFITSTHSWIEDIDEPKPSDPGYIMEKEIFNGKCNYIQAALVKGIVIFGIITGILASVENAIFLVPLGILVFFSIQQYRCIENMKMRELRKSLFKDLKSRITTRFPLY